MFQAETDLLRERISKLDKADYLILKSTDYYIHVSFNSLRYLQIFPVLFSTV